MKFKNNKIASIGIICALVIGVMNPIYANSNKQEEELSYEEAVKIAIQNSYDIKMSQNQKERAEEMGNKLSTLKPMGSMTSTGQGNGASDSKVAELSKGVEKVNIALTGADIQYNTIKDLISFGVKASFYNIEKAEKDIELADEKIKNSRQNEKITRLKEEVGNESKYTLKTSEIGTEKSEMDKKYSTELKNAEYVKLNKIMGFGENSRNKLKFEDIAYVPLKDSENDLYYRVQMAKEIDPNLWAKEKEAYIKNLDVDLYVFNETSGVPAQLLPVVQMLTPPRDPLRVKEIDAANAENEVSNMKIQIENTVRNTYNQIKQLEAKYDSLQTDMLKVDESLRVLEAKYKVGLGIKQDIEDLKLKKKELENGIFTVVINHELLKMIYEKPYLAQALSK